MHLAFLCNQNLTMVLYLCWEPQFIWCRFHRKQWQFRLTERWIGNPKLKYVCQCFISIYVFIIRKDRHLCRIFMFIVYVYYLFGICLWLCCVVSSQNTAHNRVQLDLCQLSVDCLTVYRRMIIIHTAEAVHHLWLNFWWTATQNILYRFLMKGNIVWPTYRIIWPLSNNLFSV